MAAKIELGNDFSLPIESKLRTLELIKGKGELSISGELIWMSSEDERKPVASPALIEALMTQALRDTARAYWNINQEGWGPWLKDHEDYSDIERYFPMALGDITVTHEEQFTDEGDPLGILLKFEFRHFWVTTWFDTKRLFSHACLERDVTPHELVDWFECLEEHIRCIEKAHWNREIEDGHKYGIWRLHPGRI